MTRRELDDLANSLHAQDLQRQREAEAKRQPPQSWIAANFPDGAPGREPISEPTHEWTAEQLRRLDNLF